MKTPVRSIVAVSLLSSLSLTAQVAQFQPGTPARAADMNALVTAINNNTAQLKALQDQMSIVASVTNLPQPTLQQNLAGSVYHVGILETAHGTSTSLNGEQRTRLMRHTLFGETGTLTLNTDNTVTLTLAGKESEANLTLLSGVPTADPANETPSYGSVSQTQFVENETLTGTWSVAGNVLTLNLDGDTETFSVSVDGNTLFNSAADTNNDNPNITMYSVGLDVGIRIHKPQPNILVRFRKRIVDRYEWTEATNNGDPYRLIIDMYTLANNDKLFIKNTGGANLVLGSRLMIQTQGTGLLVAPQSSPITIPPNTEIEIVVTQSSLPPLYGTEDIASIYFMSNDPDTPTLIANISSIGNSTTGN